VNVRVIAATNESLEQAVDDGRFRADLFYRLNVFPVQIPPLRDRQEDLPLLASHFLEKFHAQYDKRTLGLSDKALELCMQYRWPGNIRELENVIERGVILTDNNETISQDALFVAPPHVNPDSVEHIDNDGNMRAGKPGDSGRSWSDQVIKQGISLDQVEETLMKQAMEQANQNVSKAARLLGLTRPALAYRLKKSGILAED
jgi:transcriptional regulator with GAF, ATPase, and Fis domain